MTENNVKQPTGIKVIGVILVFFGFHIIGQSLVYETTQFDFLEASQRVVYDVIFRAVFGGISVTILFASAIGLFFKKKYAHRLTEIVAILIIIVGIIRTTQDIIGIIPIVGGIFVLVYFRQRNTKRYFWSIEDD